MSIQEARETFNKAFQEDKNFREKFQTILSMFLYASGSDNKIKCNAMADGILRLLFE